MSDSAGARAVLPRCPPLGGFVVELGIFSYKTWGLALALLVARVLADDHHVAVAADDLALVADRLDRGVDLHCDSLCSLSSYSRMRAVTSECLAVSIYDATASQVVWAQLNHHAVFGKNADVVLAHLARNVRQDLVAVRQLYPEHCVRERFSNRALDLDDAVFLGHSLTVVS